VSDFARTLMAECDIFHNYLKTCLTLILQEAQWKDLYLKNVGLNFWQFITTLSNSKKLEKARANGLKAVTDIDEKLADLRDKIQSYKDQGITLDDILNS